MMDFRYSINLFNVSTLKYYFYKIIWWLTSNVIFLFLYLFYTVDTLLELRNIKLLNLQNVN